MINENNVNKENKLDITALAIFFPSVVALAIIPVLMHVSYVISDIPETARLFSSTEKDGSLYLIDTFSQCKAFAVVVFAIIMLAVALMCCVFLFRKAEKRSLAIVGASAVYVIMALISACLSDYGQVAFYGVFDRAEGFFTTACYFVIFLFTMYAFRKEQNFRPIVFALFFCVGINAVLGIMQYTGNNPVQFDWFNRLIVDRKYYGEIVPVDNIPAKTLYGALYHYNYVGSFTGLVIPLFTTLALFEKKLGMRIACIVFDLLAAFMLLGSAARSGIVAVAAAAVVGIILFARIIAKHWKISVSVVEAAAVLLVGANAALDGALLKRVPSIFEDVIQLVSPADEDFDLFSTLPVREIKQLSDGSVTFVTQTDELNMKFDTEEYTYKFTDKSGAAVDYKTDDAGYCVIPDERYKGIEIQMLYTPDVPELYAELFSFGFERNTDKVLLFKLFGEKSIMQVDAHTGELITTENAEAIGFKGKEKIGSSRGYIWSRTIPLLKNCLVYGYGADTFPYVFPQNDFLAKYYSYAEGFTITVDKVHNLYLQILFNNGLIALIAFLFIVVWYLVDCFRLYSLRREYRETQIFGASVMLAIVGYLAAGLFNDSVVSVAPMFWILLGTGFALNTINRRADRGESVDVDEQESTARVLSKNEQQIIDTASVQGAALSALMRAKADEENRIKQEEEYTRRREEERRIIKEKADKQRAIDNGDLNAFIARMEQKQRELQQSAGEDGEAPISDENDDSDGK
ncbi:MAG: O-antigen ligase family protein [Oscillospiraceae bacterium]|nr:O-antigen ligase family protein [Oscillospiraceae bacterium]